VRSEYPNKQLEEAVMDKLEEEKEEDKTFSVGF
jgi:hypothetical protein